MADKLHSINDYPERISSQRAKTNVAAMSVADSLHYQKKPGLGAFFNGTTFHIALCFYLRVLAWWPKTTYGRQASQHQRLSGTNQFPKRRNKRSSNEHHR